MTSVRSAGALNTADTKGRVGGFDIRPGRHV